MKTEEVEDKVICEIPVYLAKGLASKLLVFQYPVHPHSRSYDDSTVLKTQIRPKSGQVEMEIGIKTRAPTYNKGKGEQIALNVDGASRDKKDSGDLYYKSNVMDKIVLSSTKAVSDVQKYAVGVISDKTVHLTPITSVLSLRPSFAYLDIADKNTDKKDHSFDDSDEEDKVRKVTVRFEKPETDKMLSARERSYNFLQKQIRDEPWVEVEYNKCGSERSEFESRKLFCTKEDSVVNHFSVEPITYLGQLIPSINEIAGTSLPAHLKSKTALSVLSISEQVKIILTNAKAASFLELIKELRYMAKDVSDTLIKILQQTAVLVQGNWVIKSEFLISNEGVMEYSLSSEVMQKSRDYILYLFTRNTQVEKSELDLLNLTIVELKSLVEGVADWNNHSKLFMFALKPDIAFINMYPDVVQRQEIIWKSRYEQLEQTFSNTKGRKQ